MLLQFSEYIVDRGSSSPQAYIPRSAHSANLKVPLFEMNKYEDRHKNVMVYTKVEVTEFRTKIVQRRLKTESSLVSK